MLDPKIAILKDKDLTPISRSSFPYIKMLQPNGVSQRKELKALLKLSLNLALGIAFDLNPNLNLNLDFLP
jgi:hypothetical protein